MACINKSTDRYKALQGRYGDFLAESFVRGNILNKKLENSEDFYIPKQEEVTEYFAKVRKPLKLKQAQDALKYNPLLDVEGIKTILQGVIWKYKDEYYVVKGTNHRGPIDQTLTLREIYKPNLEIMEKLASEYPDVFELSSGVSPNTTKVKITPKTDIEYVPEIQSSLDTYNRMLVANEGIQPDEFIVDDHLWQRVGNHLYTLIDTSTGEPFFRNINMLSGTEIVPEPIPVDKEAALAQIMDIRANYDVEYWQINFGLRGYNLEQIINNMEAAETQQEFDQMLADFLKIVC